MDKIEEMTQAQAFVSKYRPDITKLYRYVSYFIDKKGKDVANDYDGKLGHSSLKFPVYDGTLMSFIKEARQTVFMDRNYIYAYRKRRITTPREEEAAIARVTIKDIDFLNAVLSKYIMEGMRKTGMWQDAVERHLFLDVLIKYKELLDFYSRYDGIRPE